MTGTLDLSTAALAIVRNSLRAHLPPGTRVWVFGSRATGTARRYSDLDLALEGDALLSLDMLRDVAEPLPGSDLPYKVDLLDLRGVVPAFRAVIEPDMRAFPL